MTEERVVKIARKGITRFHYQTRQMADWEDFETKVTRYDRDELNREVQARTGRDITGLRTMTSGWK